VNFEEKKELILKPLFNYGKAVLQTESIQIDFEKILEIKENWISENDIKISSVNNKQLKYSKKYPILLVRKKKFSKGKFSK